MHCSYKTIGYLIIFGVNLFLKKIHFFLCYKIRIKVFFVYVKCYVKKNNSKQKCLSVHLSVLIKGLTYIYKISFDLTLFPLSNSLCHFRLTVKYHYDYLLSSWKKNTTYLLNVLLTVAFLSKKNKSFLWQLYY